MTLERPYISLGAPRGTAITSLDKYIDLKRKTLRHSASAREFRVDDHEAEIASLQREQSRLCEELNAERRRSESLKATSARVLALATRRRNEKLDQIKRFLEAEPDSNQTIKRALSLIQEIQEGAPGSGASVPNQSELAQKLKEAELANEKEAKLNRALHRQLDHVTEERNQNEGELAAAQEKLDEIVKGRQQMKDKLIALRDHRLKKEGQWKERCAALQAELDAQK
jgi:hypothetical protein